MWLKERMDFGVGCCMLLGYAIKKVKTTSGTVYIFLWDVYYSTNNRFARCRHLTTNTRIPLVFSSLFKFCPSGV